MYNTNHKTEIINLFKQNDTTAYSAKDLVNIYDGIIDKATIYRNLKQLENSDIIFKTFNPKDDTYEYVLYDKCKFHMHLKCLHCGKIVHLKCGVVNEFTNHIEREHNFKIENLSQTIYGICKECL